jgi:hypothetical protein
MVKFLRNRNKITVPKAHSEALVSFLKKFQLRFNYQSSQTNLTLSMLIDDNGKLRKTMSTNIPFYRQTWFIPVASLVGIILFLQVMPKNT